MQTAGKRIFIIGAGAMGAVYASLLYEMDPGCVSFVAGGKRRERLQKDGITVNGKHYDIPVAGPEEIRTPADLLLVAVKNQHLAQAIKDMRNFVGPATVIISLMNGLDSEEQIGAVFGPEKVLYCVNLGIDALREDNSVIYTTQGTLFFGEADNTLIAPRVQEIGAVFSRAGIVYDIPPDMRRVMWRKFMVNVGLNQASAVLGAPYAVFQTSPEARELMQEAMREVITLAQKAGVDLSEDDMHGIEPVLARLSPQGKTSMLQDVEAGRKTEVEMLAGRVIALGAQYNVPVPVNKMLLERITQIEAGK